MKPSRYTFLVVPDHDGESKRFSLSRNGTLFIIIFTIFMFIGISISYMYLIPLSLNYTRMESRYNDVIGERVEVLELYRDLERMKQMEIVVQKALGMDLGESDSSEAGLIGLCKQLSQEFCKYKIRVNCISPSQTATKMLKNSMTKQQIQNLIRSIPLGRLASTQDQSNGILFLLSSLSNYISGSSINIDGGQIW